MELNKLKDFRISKGLSQKKMAEMLGITLSMYEKVEGGRVVTPQGRSFLDKISGEIIKDIPELEKY